MIKKIIVEDENGTVRYKKSYTNDEKFIKFHSWEENGKNKENWWIKNSIIIFLIYFSVSWTAVWLFIVNDKIMTIFWFTR